MPSLHTTNPPRGRRMRAATPGLHGGASSLLRLAQPGAASRLPASGLLSQWVQRASAALAPDMAEAADDAPSAFITRLLPSAQAGLR